MLLALTTDPMFSVNYKLIKKITFIPNKVSLLTKEEVKKTKINYSDILLSNLSHTVEIENYYNNRYPTRETLNLFKKFTSLEYLSLSFYDGVSCDYIELAHLLQELPSLKTLDLDLPYELIYEAETGEFILEFKNDPIEENALKSYPNIKTLLLKGRYWPKSLLTHFPELSHLTLNYSHYELLKPNTKPNSKVNQLLEQIRYPEKLMSLEIPASVPFKIDPNKSIFKLIVSHLKQLTHFTQLQKLTINPPKNFYTLYLDGPQKKFYYSMQSPPLFLNKDYSLCSIKELKIHYNALNSYQKGDFTVMRAIFPNLSILRIKLEKSHCSFINQLSELWALLKENPWKDIQINIHGADLSQDRVLLETLSLFLNIEFSENGLTIRFTNKTNQIGEVSKKIKPESEKSFISQFFHTNDIDDRVEIKSLKTYLKQNASARI